MTPPQQCLPPRGLNEGGMSLYVGSGSKSTLSASVAVGSPSSANICARPAVPWPDCEVDRRCAGEEVSQASGRRNLRVVKAPNRVYLENSIRVRKRDLRDEERRGLP